MGWYSDGWLKRSTTFHFISDAFRVFNKDGKGQINASGLRHPPPSPPPLLHKSLNRFGFWGELRYDDKEILFQSGLLCAAESNLRLGRDIHSFTLSIKLFF
ncbi:hypothetical protein DPMN_025059 [Dreissena polymorpha]|uniref:EF-hand domain-containing protein n=1 Tax=Dreissena polymorpha TaxID=45954 RepID=A0A9D4RCY9_DREPO|nr:hypothetical protein DPMN_025059 [Dreissena polymorpha]